MTVIHIMFSSSSVILKKEVKAFSFQSLVADVGEMGKFVKSPVAVKFIFTKFTKEIHYRVQ